MEIIAEYPGLLHIPPVVASLKVVAVPAHRVVTPVTKDGKAFTVTLAVAKQPVPNV
jgi:hypothetical protein